MKIYIDQSGKKVEETNKPTVIAYANGKSKSLMISSKEKQKLKEYYRKQGKPKVFTLQVFTFLIYLLLKDQIKKDWQIVIDKEYLGHDDIIKSWLLQLFRNDNVLLTGKDITFENVGKKSKCHIKVISVYRKRQIPDKKVGYKDILTTLTHKKKIE